MSMTGYVPLPVTVDPNTLVQAALASIAAQIPGWVPREGHLEVAILEEVAQMASETASVTAQVPIAIFASYGQLVGVPPITGVAATAPVTITMANTAGYTLPAGTQFSYAVSGSAQINFTLQGAVTIPSGSTTGTGTVVCETPGTFANGLAAGPLSLLNTVASVSSVATTATTSGGVDAETTSAYINRLSDELTLMAPRPVLAVDFAAMAVNVAGVARAVGIDNLWAGRTDSAGVTASSNVVTDATAVATDVTRSVTGASFLPGTTITGVTPGVGYTTSNNWTGSTGTVSLTLGDLTSQARCVAVCGVDVNGAALSSGVQASLLAYLQAKREANFVVSLFNPTFSAIDVTYTVAIPAGAVAATVEAAVATALSNLLSPANWGGGNQNPPTWSPTAKTVRFIDVASAIRNVVGVDYVYYLAIGIHGTTLGNSDIALPGDAPLTTLGTVTPGTLSG